MKEYIKDYIGEIDKKINDNHKFSSEEIESFIFKIKLFQKERVIHLVITLSYVFFTILFLFLTKYIFILALSFINSEKSSPNSSVII